MFNHTLSERERDREGKLETREREKQVARERESNSERDKDRKIERNTECFSIPPFLSWQKLEKNITL